MKKAFIFGLIAAALGFTACSSEDDLKVNDNNQKKGMVLRATVEQTVGTRATISDDWTFAFSMNDLVLVRNDEMSPNNHYMFTKGTGDFTCISAIETKSPVTWYAYFPQVIMNLNQQSGKKEDVANFYALSGTTTSTTTGKDGLSITMEPQVAILVIDNQIGSIDINVKTGQNSWVSSLKAKTDEKGFELVTYEGKVSLLTTNTPGTYYIAVPAGVQLAIKNGDKVIRSTGTSGLTAGKYYNLTVAPTTGTAKRRGDIDVKWIQLWAGGPKWAEYNVEAKSDIPEDYGGYYKWGGKSSLKDLPDAPTPQYYDDTATILWGSNWRMPTKEEFDALMNNQNCTCTWTNQDGVNGLLCTGKGVYSTNSIFLPAAGNCDKGDVTVSDKMGFYWSSTPYQDDGAYCLGFDSNNTILDEPVKRDGGCSVRAVLVEE